MRHVEIGPIASTSPSLAEAMRMCQLRAALSRAPTSEPFALSTPQAWLGTAYHEVLEKILDADLQRESIEAAVERLWSGAIKEQYRRISLHQFNARFGLPETWPGYHLARAMALVRAREIVPSVREPWSPGAVGGSLREKRFTAFGGKLVGRPDVIRGDEVLDYKSGAILELDESANAQVVKSAYVRQLRIYGFLVHETLGWWPKRGILLPMIGTPAEVVLDPDGCAREAEDAVKLLDNYNAAVAASVAPAALASPSTTACKWCQFKSICDAFWNSVTTDWSGQLDGACAEGVLGCGPRSLHGGMACSLCLEIERGTEGQRRADIAPLPLTVHPDVMSYSAGERVRLVGLRARGDGVFVPTARTIVTRVAHLPTLVIRAETSRSP